MGDTAPRAELLFDHDADEEATEEFEVIFRKLGFITNARRRVPHRGPNELTWLMLVAVPLQAFLAGIGAETVKDLYAKAKQLAPSRKKAKNAVGQAPLVLHDSKTELQIVLDADLPAEAIRQLTGLDLGAYRTGPLHYDKHRKKWRSELDEAGD